MFKPLELFIGLRYIRAKRRNQFISFISLTSILGIILGVTALITVLSVMNGFVTELRDRILSMASHVVVSGLDGELHDWHTLAGRIEKLQPRVIGLAPFIQGEGMLTAGHQVKGVMVRGIYPDEEPKVSDVGRKMLAGELSDLKAGNYNIVLGISLARSLGVMPGDKVTLVTPQALSTPAGILPRLKRFTVSGVFEVGHNEYDTSLAIINLDDAAKLYRMDGNVSGLRLKLDDLFAATEISYRLAEQLHGAYWVTDWTRQHANFFRAVHLEKRMMFLILMIIVVVAAFNILSALVMVVTDKQSDIAILRTLGASPRSIMIIFMIQGTIIGIAGTLLGMAGGISLALNVATVVPFIEHLFGIQFMPPDVYQISDFPSELHWDDVIQICSFAFLISVCATLYPAWNASRTQPAEALRYE
jgi:lipoprotein-releasing system permease protein